MFENVSVSSQSESEFDLVTFYLQNHNLFKVRVLYYVSVSVSRALVNSVYITDINSNEEETNNNNMTVLAVMKVE